MTRSTFFPWLLVAIGVAIYAGTLNGPLIYDDDEGIAQNPYIRSWSTFWMAEPDCPTEGRPVIGLSLAANYALGGIEDLRGYHVVNIAVHILCALVLYGIVRRTLRLEKLRPRFGPPADGIALAVALLWMVHPLVTEPVNYITQRTESIMALFYLLTLYCAIRAIDAPRRGAWIAAAVASCALGMGSKEVMITAPIVVLLYDLVFHSGSAGEILRKRAPLYVGLAATWGVLAALMAYFPHQGTVGFSHGVSAWQYASNQAVLIVDYLRLAVWPHPLTIDYGKPQALALGEVAPYGLLVIALLVATVAALIYRPMWGFLGAWFFIILAPTSSFIPLRTEVGAERRMYLPLAALVVLVVLGGYLLLERFAQGPTRGRKKKAAAAADESLTWLGGVAVGVAAAILMAGTVARNRDYETTVAIWRSAAAAKPNNARAHFNLGLQSTYAGDGPQAIASYEEAIRLLPDYTQAHSNLGLVLANQEDLPQAIKHLKRVVQLNPDLAKAHVNLGSVLARSGAWDEAAVHFGHAVQLEPNDISTHFSLARVRVEQRKFAQAEQRLQQALRIDPNYQPAQHLLQVVRQQMQAAE